MRTHDEATITVRVGLGAALLDDEWDGDGQWYNQINLDRLDMRIGYPAVWAGAEEAGCGCILAQLYGTYRAGQEWLDIDGPMSEELGFEAIGMPLNIEYDALLEGWTELIANRRVANQVIPDLGGYDA